MLSVGAMKMITAQDVDVAGGTHILTWKRWSDALVSNWKRRWEVAGGGPSEVSVGRDLLPSLSLSPSSTNR